MVVEKLRFLRLKSFVKRIIRTNLVGRIVELIYKDAIPSFDIKVIADDSIQKSLKAAIFFRLFESAEIRYIRNYLEKDADLIELGSGIGIVSAHIASKLSKGKKLICVEANPIAIKNLKKNIELHGEGLETAIENAAISYSNSKEVDFYLAPSHLASKLTAPQQESSVKSGAVSLSDIVEKYEISRFSLVMDIEGAESEILNFDKAALEKCQTIVAELHDSKVGGRLFTIQDCIDMLVNRYGFSLVARRDCVCFFRKLTKDVK
jgi:FkbM family methyltransferase